MRPRDTSYLWDMLEAARAILRFTDGMTEADFLVDERTQAAVERKVEIIGEAARRLSDECRSEHSVFDWKGIVGLRTVLAHDYDSIIKGQIWLVAAKHIPELVRLLEPLVPNKPDQT